MPNNKTLPLRQELEKFGYNVQWQGVGQPIRVTKGGQTWDIPATEYEVRGDRAYVAPETLTRITSPDLKHIRPYFEEKGYEVGWEPTSSRVTVTHPITGETQYARPEALWGGQAYFKPATLAAIEERLTPAYEKTYGELTTEYGKFMNQMQNYIGQYINTMNDYMRQYSDQAVAMLAAYQQQYAQALNNLYKLMEPQTEVPESVKVALKVLQEQTDENIRLLREEMNRRGILQSGIAADMEAKLRKGQLTEQEKILAGWLDQQHKQMFSAAMAAAQMQAQYASGYAQMYEKAYLEPMRRYMDYAGQIYQLQSGLAQTAYDLASKLKTWYAEKEDAARKARQTAEAAQQRYLLDLYKTMLGEEYRWASLQSLDAYRQAMAELSAARLEQQISGRVSEEATNAYMADLMSPEIGSAAEAFNYIARYKDDIIASGADVGKLLNAIRKRWPAATDLLDALESYGGWYGYGEIPAYEPPPLD